MPEDLDPTTARLVSELSALILPSLTKSLAGAIPVNDFSAVLERNNRTSQELRSGIEKALRSAIDDSRAGRSMIMQSLASVIEEISELRSKISKLPETVKESVESIKSNQPEIIPDYNSNSENILSELEGISERIDALTQGIKAFFETYASQIEQLSTANLNSVIPPSGSAIESEAISGLEGLIRAGNTSHSKELEELSREISAMTEQNNIALIHEVKEAVTGELEGISDGVNSGREAGSEKLLKISAGLSGICAVLIVINILIMIFK